MPTPAEAKAAGMPVVLEKVLQHIRENQLRLGFEPSTAAQLDALIDDCWDYVYARNPRAAVTGALNTELGTEHLLRLEADLHMERWRQNFELNDPQPGEGGGGGGEGEGVVTATSFDPSVLTAASLGDSVYGTDTSMTATNTYTGALSSEYVSPGDMGYVEIHREAVPQNITLGVCVSGTTIAWLRNVDGAVTYVDGFSDGANARIYAGVTEYTPQPDIAGTTIGMLVDYRGPGCTVYVFATVLSTGLPGVWEVPLTLLGSDITDPVRFQVSDEANAQIGLLYTANPGNTAAARGLYVHDVPQMLINSGRSSVAAALPSPLAWKVAAAP